MSHGIVTLHAAGLLTLEEAMESSLETAFNLFVAFGDDKTAARRSIDGAMERILADDSMTTALAAATTLA
jgi:hypothetical protein